VSATGDLFHSGKAGEPECLVDANVIEALDRNAVVAIGVSGGKDSQACAIATVRHLDAVGHTGPRVLVHADLGMVEWSASLPVCHELAAALGLELIVVARKAGGLMERWESRWASSVRRYAALETVTLVLPWSTPSMRFCTSELKTHVITAHLRSRFRGLPIVNVTGQRREESAARAKLYPSSFDLSNSRPGAPFLNWRPILDWKVGEVFGAIAEAGLKPHEAYTVWKSSRVSCRFCIMSSAPDLAASASDPESHELLRRMVQLELTSTFGFQGNRWLADLRPDILPAGMLSDVPAAKKRAAIRVSAEQSIPDELLYVKGWPTFVPTLSEAEIIAGARREVSAAIGIDAGYLNAASVVDRYAELFAQKHGEEVAA